MISQEIHSLQGDYPLTAPVTIFLFWNSAKFSKVKHSEKVWVSSTDINVAEGGGWGVCQCVCEPGTGPEPK